MGTVQIVIQGAGQSRPPVSSESVVRGQFGGVAAQQVVALVSAGRVLGDEAGPDQLDQAVGAPRPRDRCQAGGGGHGEIRAGMDGEQPEQPGGGGSSVR